MKPGDRIAAKLPAFLVYDPEEGWTEHDTEEDAERVFDAIVDDLRDDASDGWHESADLTAMFRLVPIRRLVLAVTAVPDDGTEDGERCAAAGWDYMCDGVVVVCSP